MKNKLWLLLLFVCLLAGCQTETETIGNKKTAPLDRIVEAMNTDSVSAYESAFPHSFCEQYQTHAGNLQEQIEMLLTEVRAFDLDRYGNDCKVTYELTDSQPYDIGLLELYNQSVSPDFTYTLPIESVTDACEISVTVRFDGSFDAETFSNTYLVLCIDGVWYLHPKHFGTVLKK